MSEWNNICKFSEKGFGESDLFAFQFVFETMSERLGNDRTYAAFCCHLVTQGDARLCMETGEWNVQKGDIFFTFPDLKFTLKGSIGFQYLYISFVGNRVSDLLESIGITRRSPVCKGYSKLEDIWFGALLSSGSENLSFFAKGILYYTFAHFKHSVYRSSDESTQSEDVITLICDAIEKGFANSELSLDYLCGLYHYNSKYISRRFREVMKVNFSEYLTSCRIRHACMLLKESSLSIQEVAASVGYGNALYFSKVFKKIMLVTPSQYRMYEKREVFLDK